MVVTGGISPTPETLVIGSSVNLRRWSNGTCLYPIKPTTIVRGADGASFTKFSTSRDVIIGYTSGAFN